MLWLIWIIAAALLMLIELHTGTFYFLLLAVAAVCSMLFDLAGFSFSVQCFVFAAVTFFSYVFLLPLLRKIIPASKASVEVTADRLVGREAIVIQDIAPGEAGMVTIHGETWSAVSDEHIQSGEKVRIIEAGVTKLHVERE